MEDLLEVAKKISLRHAAALLVGPAPADKRVCYASTSGCLLPPGLVHEYHECVVDQDLEELLDELSLQFPHCDVKVID